MAVFTEVSEQAARALLRLVPLGELTGLRGIEGGIENTNYFLSTDQGEWVLTLFERLSAEQLPFYLYLMQHLARHGIPVPDPQANAHTGAVLHEVCGKPAAIVQRLAGKSQLAPQPVHCAAVGDMLARMHLAGRSYERQQPNLRGLPWWNDTVPLVLPHLDSAAAALQRGNQHPLAKAILQAAPAAVPPATDLLTRPGLGITGRIAGQGYLLGSRRLMDDAAIDCHRLQAAETQAQQQGFSVAWLAREGDSAPLAMLSFGDASRPQSAAAIDALFFFDPNHCRKAYESERRRLQQAAELRT